MHKRLIEFHKQALLKVFNNQPQDGEGVTRRQQAEIDRPIAPLVPDHSANDQRIPLPQETIVTAKKTVPFQKEEVVIQNKNLKIFIVKSDLKRMVQFKMLDHQFTLRIEV